MGERKGTKGLELWCRRLTEGYPGVKVTNMTTSWRDGLAFCAIIHHFRPDLIEFSKLNKDDVYHNNELAFRVAERHLGIPALLEPEDMVEFPVPDRLSILTYLSQFYQTFAVAQGKSPARIAPKRPSTTPDHGIVSPASTSPPTKVPIVGKIRRDPCAKCNLPVFIAERLNVGKLLYHRTCFRCARCNSQLTLANYYETENNEFCCETCPDEEKSRDLQDSGNVLTRSLSDEEKSASLKKSGDFHQTDDYSTKFETALEFPQDDSLKRNATLSQYTKARSFFMNSQVGDVGKSSNSSDSGNEDVNVDGSNEPPDLPRSKPPPTLSAENLNKGDSCGISDFPTSTTTAITTNNKSVNSENNLNKPSDSVISSINIDNSKSHDVVTKDTISAEGDTSSLVKARMRLFEAKSDVSNDNSSVNKNNPQVPSKKSSDNLNVSESFSFIDNVSMSESTLEATDDSFQVVRLESCYVEPQEASVITVSDSQSEEVIVIDDSEEDESLQEVTDKIINEAGDIEEDKSLQQEVTDKIINEAGDVEEDKSPQQEVLKEEADVTGKIIIEDDDASKDSAEYPDDLNPFEEEEEVQGSSGISLNPFDEDETEDKFASSPKPAVRKKLLPSTADKRVSRIYIERVSVNPFEDDEDEENGEAIKKQPEATKRRLIAAPRVSLNPFWSDDDANEESLPVPKPRISKTSTFEQKPRESGLSITNSTFGGSSNSLASYQSGVTFRKKKAAPRPPGSLQSSPSHSATHSPKSTSKVRKAKKAPLPPTSTPLNSASGPPKIDLTLFLGGDFEKEKSLKDEENRHKQNQMIASPSSSENSASLGLPNKSTYGKWKRRKGQAPSRPIPQKRTIKALPIVEVKRELDVIEIQQQGLEKQGVRLEQIIRDRCEGPNSNPDESLPPEVEDMVLQLFELVNEKNELFRRQAELMYLRRQQRLEEEHADVEYQIRCLMLQPEANKTDSDKAREEELINRLVEIVERKDEIVQCLEMDRLREAEEDDSINNQLNLYTLKKNEPKVTEQSKKEKKSKKHKKEKKLKLKGNKVDADKDIDESETSTSSAVNVKEKKKKKFNIF